MMLDQEKLISEKGNLNPDMLKLARESRGLTQKELCEKMDVRQGTISKIENRLLPFGPEIAERATNALDYPINFFSRCKTIHPLSVTYYRRNLNLSAKTLQQIEAKIDIACLHIESLMDSVEYGSPNLFVWDVKKYGEPERAAKTLREQWRIPKGPIRKLLQLIEDNGILVVEFDFGVDTVDGIAVRGAHNLPIIFFNKNLPNDRKRLTVAHELGHLAMHIGQIIEEDRDEEDEAFRFASEFLVPNADFSKSFTRLDLPTLAGMKQYWAVSMSSLIVKAQKTSRITANQARYLWAQMAKNNYLKREPQSLDVIFEEPTLLKEVIDVHLNDLKYSTEELTTILALHPAEFKQLYLGERKGLFQITRNSNPAFENNDGPKTFNLKRV
jgi:Zn-dependent peptidase ImmA (M78 family)/DNA-binding XRE family transcriptional regulator